VVGSSLNCELQLLYAMAVQPVLYT
jgi:hypothetical protein